MSGFGFRVSGFRLEFSRYRVLGLSLGSQSFRSWDWVSGVYDLVFRVRILSFGVWGIKFSGFGFGVLGLRVQGSRISG